MANDFGSQNTLRVGQSDYTIHRLDTVSKAHAAAERLPFCLKILLENLLRRVDGQIVKNEDVEALANWDAKAKPSREIAFMPARVLLQDFTGVPAVVDLAAMRDAMVQLGGDPKKINPLLAAELVIDHSVQVDTFGTELAFRTNSEMEFARNRERYTFLKWGQTAFEDFKVVPPETGIVHQVNLEYLARVVFVNDKNKDQLLAYPDTLVGTDSHTTMINGLGVLGWGVGGIEAEAAMLGQPVSMLIPQVVGFKLSGRLPEGATATDLVLVVTQMLREKGVVGKFVEFFGPALGELPLADRATIANMAPEYGATCGIFPIDAQTLTYLRFSSRSEQQVNLVEAYAKEQGLFHTPETPDATYTDTLELDLSTVEPSLAGPSRPQDRVTLSKMKSSFNQVLPNLLAKAKSKEDSAPRADASITITIDDQEAELRHGAVVIAAITSCTNTSNPSVMLASGLLAKKAVERGLKTKPWVKTSLAPGSKVVTDYLVDADVMRYLEQLRFHLVGYGCTTCIAEGTPVLLGNGTTRPIEEMPSAGGAVLYGPTSAGSLGLAHQAERMDQGYRECVSLVLQDGRTLVCTPDHEILCADGSWVRADELAIDEDRVVVGLEAPLDETGIDELGYTLRVGKLTFAMDAPHERLRTLAFARLLGHLLCDGSISIFEQGRMHVGQAVDRETVLNDIELLTGKRPAATQYDEQKWTVVLPLELTQAIVSLEGVRVGRRIHQSPTLPEFVLADDCPVSVVREFLGGLFGADGHAPVLHRHGETEEQSCLKPPAFSQSATPEHVEQLAEMMGDVLRLLARCGVETEGAKTYQYPTRRSASSYPKPRDGKPRTEVRLVLPDGLSFVERVGYRYSVDKTLRASAAAIHWRTVGEGTEHQVPSTEYRVLSTPTDWPTTREPSLVGCDQRGTSAGTPQQRETQPSHGGPASLRSLSHPTGEPCVEKDSLTLPTFALRVVDRRPAGMHRVYDLAVEEVHAFVAGSVAVHNCIGNSGPLPEPVSKGIIESNLIASSVLSGNRNFEGRVHPQVRASYLASPPLVVAYALAGTVDIDLQTEPLGNDDKGEPVYLKDIWPSQQEIRETIEKSVRTEMFAKEYGEVFVGNAEWQAVPVPTGDLYQWEADSTYVKNPPYFEGMQAEPDAVSDIKGARVLCLFGDSITTDHISPAGSIKADSPAGKYLIDKGVTAADFNSYGSRRGNHEVMMRGTFANVRLKNLLAPGTEGGVTRHLPDGEEMSIFDASMKYQAEKTPTIVLAGKEYGTGSSRDWAAKGPRLLGIHAVIAVSYERIHRSNLIGMGILPLEFTPGEDASSLGLTGEEVFDIEGLPTLFEGGLNDERNVTVKATSAGDVKTFQALARIDTPQEAQYYRHGGILSYVLRQLK